jgi:hypothetical protein
VAVWRQGNWIACLARVDFELLAECDRVDHGCMQGLAVQLAFSSTDDDGGD